MIFKKSILIKGPNLILFDGKMGIDVFGFGEEVDTLTLQTKFFPKIWWVFKAYSNFSERLWMSHYGFDMSCNIDPDLIPHIMPAGISFPDLLYLIPITIERRPEATGSKVKKHHDIILIGCCNQFFKDGHDNQTYTMRP